MTLRAFIVAAGGLMVAGSSVRAESPVHRAPARASKITNPLDGNEQAPLAGAKLYARECAACHGAAGAGGGKAPALTQTEVSSAAPGTLFWVLRNGSLYRGMPSFAHLPEPQRWQIVTYLRTLRPNATAAVKPNR
ncbi:MAG: c-type cytochrome [Acidobacteriia bacterium]|nr:c-type cytochrome [Terriglobia bacterium]